MHLLNAQDSLLRGVRYRHGQMDSGRFQGRGPKASGGNLPCWAFCTEVEFRMRRNSREVTAEESKVFTESAFALPSFKYYFDVFTPTDIDGDREAVCAICLTIFRTYIRFEEWLVVYDAGLSERSGVRMETNV